MTEPPTSIPASSFAAYGARRRYGVNNFSVEADSAIVSDAATGLLWEPSDNGVTRSWPEALEYCESLELGGYDDRRLPNNKELQSIVAYGTTEVPAIDQLPRLARGWRTTQRPQGRRGGRGGCVLDHHLRRGAGRQLPPLRTRLRRPTSPRSAGAKRLRDSNC